MTLSIDQPNKEQDLDKVLDLRVTLAMHFSFSRERLNELFTERQLEADKVTRNLTDDECQDLIWALTEYIEDQLYDMYHVNLDQEGYIDEFINDQLPSVS